MSILPTFMISLLTFILLLRFLIFPVLFRALTNFRVSSFSPLSAYGLEWRLAAQANSVVPTLRIERLRWAWGGLSGDEVGLVVLRLDGVSFRIKEKAKSSGAHVEVRQRPKPPGRMASYKTRFISSVLHLFIHHFPGIARLVSIQISDIRIIFDDLAGLELTVRNVRLGVKVDIEADGSVDGGPSSPSLKFPPGSPITDKRDHPLASEDGDVSLSPSPLTTIYTSFLQPFTGGAVSPSPASDSDSPSGRISRLSYARRRASMHYTKMSTMASQICSRAITTSHGSVSFSACFQDVSVILPHESAPPPVSARQSISELQLTRSDGFSHRASHKPLPNRSESSAPESARPISFASVQSLNSIFCGYTNRYALPSQEGGYLRLLCIEGVSRAVFGLGVGPKKGLLGEDALRTTVDLGKLQTSLGAAEKLQELFNARKSRTKKEEVPTRKNTWSPRAMPRIILRAFETVSLSFSHLTLSHYLPHSTKSPSESASSSSTDLTVLASRAADFFTVSLDLDSVFCRLSAADSSNNERARNAFGSNLSPESRVRGVAFALQWSSIALQCIAPGEASDEKSQLFAVRQAEFKGLSTWRPRGWTREELLFANDPNLALVVGRGTITSVDVAGDLQLIQELMDAWKGTGPQRPVAEAKVEPIAEKRHRAGLSPRIRMVLDVGHAMVLLTDRVSEHKTTLTLASDGLHLGCSTSFSEVIGRRRERSATKVAFREEEELQARRAEGGDEVDLSLPASMLKPKYRRKCTQVPATIPDDYAVSMRADASLALEPMSLHMTLSGENSRGQRTYHLGSIGRAHGTITGDVLGRQEVQPDGSDISTLDSTSVSCNVDLGIDQGIKIHLWNMPVIDALVTMGQAHRQSTAPTAVPTTTPIAQNKLLARLPSGISARVSLGLISVFIGHEDPNPHCKLGLTRGLWIQASATLEYAFYENKAQTMTCRHALATPQRAELRLPEYITTQALAFFHHLLSKQGKAALVSFTLQETLVMPIFNGQRFVSARGTSMSHETVQTPKERASDDYVGWEFRRPHPKFALNGGEFATNIPPLETSDTDRARRPLICVPMAGLNWLVQRGSADGAIEHKLTSRVGHTNIVCDLSHIYSALSASQTIKNISRAWKKPTQPSEAKAAANLSIGMSIPHITAHFAFPLREHLYLYLGEVDVAKPPNAGVTMDSDHCIAYVPNAQEIGAWEELGRIKHLSVRSAPPGTKQAFDVGADAMRIRIPAGYTLSKLVLNINVTIKAIKLLLQDFGGTGFSTVKMPVAKAPKRIPTLNLAIKHLCLEARDDPIETDLNLIWQAGKVEQEARNELEGCFEQKLALVAETGGHSSEKSVLENRRHRRSPRLTHKSTVSADEARYRLDWWKSLSWIKRIKAARTEQRGREEAALQNYKSSGPEIKLPITIVQSPLTAPLFRATLDGVKLGISDLGTPREAILQYMSEVSTPFEDDTEFSLMVPLELSWSMDSATVRLRDYPLPLIRIPHAEPASARPAWHLETPFIIAEEFHGDDSCILIPCEIIPPACGAKDAAPFIVQVAKTIMPVKTYARPIIEISSERTTEFAWGNSYQPAIQDFMRVVESLTQPPRDPSPKVGFWDKFRMILHWRVTVDLTGPVHLHLKGSYDPYAVNGWGAGFALAWRHNTQLRIAQPNPQNETIQISAEELLITIPDLSALHESAAIGAEGAESQTASIDPGERQHAEPSLVSNRCTKPCARFLNGVRVGFGFVFERTCRPWTCQNHCGATDNLFHRQCRVFDFKRHQEVILRSSEVVERAEQQSGHVSDSWEGFRSDYIHFSISLVAPTTEEVKAKAEVAERSNSFHFSPKAFAHFFAWWRLFDHTLSLPIRQGKLFSDSPHPSKKFGRCLGTIKYRFDLAPVYLSHMYAQTSPEHWAAGKSDYLGVKLRFDRFRADAHQRAQEKVVRHEMLHRTTLVIHKPFYAADLILNNINLKGVLADFRIETNMPSNVGHDVNQLPKASDLDEEYRTWYNFFDFIDADRKPFDVDPRVDMVDIAECPAVFFSKRVKARQSTPNDDDGSSLGSGSDSRLDIESSKFGHEKSHICYLGAAKGVGPTQMEITNRRIDQLEARLTSIPENCSGLEKVDQTVTSSRLRTLRKHYEELSSKETRHIDDATLESAHGQRKAQEKHPGHNDVAFENTFHVHCPRIFFTNASRNILYKYYFSSRDRKREDYYTSYASLRGVRDGIQRRLRMFHGRLDAEESPSTATTPADAAVEMLLNLERSLKGANAANHFKLSSNADSDGADLRMPSKGIPPDTVVKPKNLCLFLKPQIDLRSQVDDNSIVLLAVEEISFNGFAIVDEMGTDDVSADVMTRNYVTLKGLQAFYPTEETMCRERGPFGVPRGLDVVPLEIFLDVRSEATDYDRIVLKTDAALSFDNFNHLRLPRGLQWPESNDENGSEVNHLRMHQDLTTIIVPRLTVSATSKHFNALYNVVTDLLLYQDPGHRNRSERIDNFVFAFDRKDRDPVRLLSDLFHLQQSIRSLASLQRGYEANVDLLTDGGKAKLFKIRTDLLEATEQLFTVFELIAVNTKRDEARAALATSTRMDVRVGAVAWHMLQDDFKPLVNLDIDGTLLSLLTNKDGSTDMAVVVNDLSAHNSNPEALYPEVLVRYDSSGSSKKRSRDPFASMAWSMIAPVGGITIVRNCLLYLHPVRFRLEERVGHLAVDYFLRRARRAKGPKSLKDKDGNGTSTPKAESSGFTMTLLGESFGKGVKAAPGTDMLPLTRTKSATSIASQATSGSRGNGQEGEGIVNAEKFTMVPIRDAAEMRRRANKNKTFIKVVVLPTYLVFSHKGDDSKKHHRWRAPDVVDFKVKLPEFVYTNKVWGWDDVWEHLKRDARSHIWTQTGDLVSQMFKKTSIFRTKKSTSPSEILRTTSKGFAISPSRLQYHVELPILAEEDQVVELGLAGAISRMSSRGVTPTPPDAATNRSEEDSATGGTIRSRESRETTPSLAAMTANSSGKAATSAEWDDNSRDEEEDEEESSGSDSGANDEDEDDGKEEKRISKAEKAEKAVKGFLGKLRTRHTSGAQEPGGHTSSMDRVRRHT